MSAHHHEEAHSGGFGLYVVVWFTLVGFTGLTVAIAGVNLEGLLGQWITVTLAMVVASTKTYLVGYYFMHLKHEPVLFKVMVLVCLVTFIIFIGLTFIDVIPRY